MSSSASNIRSADFVDRLKTSVSARSGQPTLVAIVATLAFAIVVYFDTYASMVRIWLQSETFLHGILVLPISIYLVRRRWPVLSRIEFRAFAPGLVFVLGIALFWWLCDILGIQVGKQFAAVLLIPAIVLTIAGTAFTRKIAFPLGYLVFAVPFGEGAIPYLIDFTAYFTVGALQLFGFPVLRDGAFFSIPAGDFEVAKACSGVRYLLASLALGTLYGYLIFESYKKRVLFFLFSLLLPIVANGLRAFGIVLLAHYSGMKLAVGVDHLIFGWIFFGLVMLLMFWAGDRFRDPQPSDAGARSTAPAAGPRNLMSYTSTIAIAACTWILVLTGPSLSLAARSVPSTGSEPAVPAAIDDWKAVPAAQLTWQPRYVGATHETVRRYRSSGDGVVDLAMVRYDGLKQGAELANATNAIASQPAWRERELERFEITVLGGQSLFIRQSMLFGESETRLVWAWHEVNGDVVYGDFDTKLSEAQSLLSWEQPLSAAVIVSAPVFSDVNEVRATLGRFVREGWVPIHECLYFGLSKSGSCVAIEARAAGAAGEPSAARDH